MKKLFSVVIVLLSAAPAMALEDVKISGAVEIQYRASKDYYDDSTNEYGPPSVPTGEYQSIPDDGESGGDLIRPEELYLKVSARIDEGVEGLIKLDGADMDKNSSDDKYVEEAQVIFTELGLRGLTLVAGKDEMPFGQDYEQFLLNSATHELEIDKVWGLHGIYHFSGLGKVAAAVFEADRDADTSVQDSFAARGTMDELIKNLSVEVSVARRGEDKAAVPAEQDETRINAGGVFKWGDFTFHAEQTLISNYNNEDDRDLTVTQVGADFRLGDFLIKARQEVIDDDNPVALVDSQELKVAGGVNYYFSDKAFAALEYEFTKWDIADDSNEVLFGVKFIF